MLVIMTAQCPGEILQLFDENLALVCRMLRPSSLSKLASRRGAAKGELARGHEDQGEGEGEGAGVIKLSSLWRAEVKGFFPDGFWAMGFGGSWSMRTPVFTKSLTRAVQAMRKRTDTAIRGEGQGNAPSGVGTGVPCVEKAPTQNKLGSVRGLRRMVRAPRLRKGDFEYRKGLQIWCGLERGAGIVECVGAFLNSVAKSSRK